MELRDTQVSALREAYELQSLHLGDDGWLGFAWHEVHSTPATLNSLVALSLMDISYQSRKYVNYKIRDMIKVEELLAMLDMGAQADVPDPELVIPSDLFEVVVGHTQTVNLIKMALAASDPVHVLLEGEPASGKSLILSELSRLPGSRFAVGGTASKAGIVDFLIEVRPRFLIIDELEKADHRDMDVLLSLMEDGRVTRLKRGMREDVHIKTWVFGGCNSRKGISPPLLSRFASQYMKPYTQADFEAIASTILRKREHCIPDIADMIVSELQGKTLNPRDAVKVARMAKTKEDVKTVVEALWT